MDVGEPCGKVRGACHLMLSEQLEGTGVHEKLAALIEGGEELEVAVARTRKTRTESLSPLVFSTVQKNQQFVPRWCDRDQGRGC